MADNSNNWGTEEQKTNRLKMAKVDGDIADVETGIKEGSRAKEEFTEELQGDIESLFSCIPTDGAAAAPESGRYEPECVSNTSDWDPLDMKYELGDSDNKYNRDDKNSTLTYSRERQGMNEPDNGVSNIDQHPNDQPLLQDKSHNPLEFPSGEPAEGAEACLAGKLGDQRESVAEWEQAPTPAQLSAKDCKSFTGSSLTHVSLGDTEERFPTPPITVGFLTEPQPTERKHSPICDRKQVKCSQDQHETQSTSEKRKQASDDSERTDGSERTDDATNERTDGSERTDDATNERTDGSERTDDATNERTDGSERTDDATNQRDITTEDAASSTETTSNTPIPTETQSDASASTGTPSNDPKATETPGDAPTSTGTPSYTPTSGEVPSGALSNAPECTLSSTVQSVPPRPSFPCPGLDPHVQLRFIVHEITDSGESRQLVHDINVGAPGMAEDRQQARAEAAGHFRDESPEDRYAIALQTGAADLTDNRDLPEGAQEAEAMEPLEFNAAADFQIFDVENPPQSEADEQILRIVREQQRNPSLSGEQLLQIILDVLGLMPRNGRPCQKTRCERESQVLLFPCHHRVCEPCYHHSCPSCPVRRCRVTHHFLGHRQGGREEMGEIRDP